MIQSSDMQIGELFMLGFRSPEIPPWLEAFAAKYGLGGVILFDYDCGDKKYERNVFSPVQVKELCGQIHNLPSRPLVFVDQEGGKVRRLKERLGFAPLVSAKQFATLAATARTEMVKNSFSEMKALGIDVNLAPVVDVDYNPENPDIGTVERSFSPDLATVRDCALTQNRIAKALGLKLCLKHFPGCGGARVNAHLDLMDLSECLNPDQVALFEELLAEIPMVLMSHGTVHRWGKDIPMSLSPTAVEIVRRAQPEAVIITDDLQMNGLQKRISTTEACIQAVTAGVDLLCIGNNLMDEQSQSDHFAQALIAETSKNLKLRSHLDGAIRRIRNLKES